ncbi:unnamed protein product [Didymodactylos carnosus]|uniref:Uncharacterized protein n=1 Tax=Didymodactylos carnosus TaxID=1234261 RepID=A0A814ZJH2_9BILA|nr:unnamed protein product [Didymodactylos carnosus]CAF1242688.1 unnamed protein product [Didymodactylos carnosus]CAF4006535.1 unnamed protein product [Didymodactylos carnosus]CAF4011553.1 unnamed protein product [Didymodactylos carnosus]
MACPNRQLFMYFQIFFIFNIVEKSESIEYSLATNVFLPADSSLNPYNDPFINKIIYDNHNHNNNSRKRERRDVSKSIKNSDGINFQIISQPIIDERLHNLLKSAPVAINLLGQLMVLSSKIHVSFLDYGLPGDEYIKYPQSFGATLVQLANGIYPI